MQTTCGSQDLCEPLLFQIRTVKALHHFLTLRDDKYTGAVRSPNNINLYHAKEERLFPRKTV